MSNSTHFHGQVLRASAPSQGFNDLRHLKALSWMVVQFVVDNSVCQHGLL